jgi:GntR family transcriptional regulator
MTTSRDQSRKSTAQVVRAPGAALHRQIFIILRDQILRGLYPPRTMIPTEEVLCAQFNVSRITVRRAVTDLAATGLLQKQPGLGTFVAANLPPRRTSISLGFMDSLRASSLVTEMEVLSVNNAQPPPEIAEQLDLVVGTMAVRAVRLRRSGGEPVIIAEAWVPGKFGSKITRRALEKQAFYELLAAQGMKVDRIVQEMTAVAASAFLAEQLHTELGSPLLKISHVIHDTERHPAAHLTIHMCPERGRLLLDTSLQEVAKSLFYDLETRT